MIEFYGRDAVCTTGTCSYCEEHTTQLCDVMAGDASLTWQQAKQSDVVVENGVCPSCVDIIVARKQEAR